MASCSVERTSVKVSTTSAVLLLRLMPPTTAPATPPSSPPTSPPRLRPPELLFLVTTSGDRKSTRLNSSHLGISYAVFCLKKKNKKKNELIHNDSAIVDVQ